MCGHIGGRKLVKCELHHLSLEGAGTHQHRAQSGHSAKHTSVLIKLIHIQLIDGYTRSGFPLLLRLWFWRVAAITFCFCLKWKNTDFSFFLLLFLMLRSTKNARKMDVQDFQTWNLSAALPSYLLVPFFLVWKHKSRHIFIYFCRPTATQKERQFWLFLSASKKIIQVAHKVGFLARLGVHS